MKEQSRKEPFINIWFGNFYEPAFSDEKFIEEAIKEIKELGFDNVMLDSKTWKDFFERYEGKEASRYVKMQEFMMKTIQKYRLSHNFLAIYLNGDNLYPHIRFSPPVLGEPVVKIDGTEGRWYKYWSEKVYDVMIEHVKGLFNLYSPNHSTIIIDGEERIPICSMWDPIVEPSFDAEGIDRYSKWLSTQYNGNIETLNNAYEADFECFEKLQPKDYWFQLKYGDNELFTEDDVIHLRPRFLVWADNLKWKRQEFREYFKSMQMRFKKLNPKLYLSPNISQWSIFLNINGPLLKGVSFSDWWDTANRGIDPYEIINFVDNCSFTAVPVTPYGDADAYVVSCQHSMIRSMNRSRDFSVGIFFGRFLYNDIYKYLTPAEMIGTSVASGAKGYFVYGYCGLDDGGIMHRMDKSFKDSIRIGNEWAKKVIPLIKGKQKKDIAILFPSAMALLEPFLVNGNSERRLDMLGWYKSACDAGFLPDVIHLNQIEEGLLNGYKNLIITANDCYAADRKPKAEGIIKQWVHAGGILIHGPEDKLVEYALGISGVKTDKDCIFYHEGAIPVSNVFNSYEGDTVIASYVRDGNGCIVKNSFNHGMVYSFGFNYGYSYVSRIIPNVPEEQGNKEFYPVPFLKKDPYQDILFAHNIPAFSVNEKNIGIAVFDNGAVIVNHSSYPFDTNKIKGKKCFQYDMGNENLIPHSAVFVEF